MWYRKRKDAEALYIASQCGILVEFNILGDVLHQDDLKIVKEQLLKGIIQETIDCLFTKTELSQCLLGSTTGK